jgi:hypothetical protein
MHNELLIIGLIVIGVFYYNSGKELPQSRKVDELTNVMRKRGNQTIYNDNVNKSDNNKTDNILNSESNLLTEKKKEYIINDSKKKRVPIKSDYFKLF